MRTFLKKIRDDTRGASIISAMAAFLLLLIGIAGFYTAVQTSSNMVLKASGLNDATGKITGEFYQKYMQSDSFAEAGATITVKEENGNPVFYLRGNMNNMNLKATITTTKQDGTEETEELDYRMYFFK